MKQTQDERVEKILLSKGKINNFQSIMALRIWRLGACINRLRTKGLNISGEYMMENGKKNKIFEYKLIK